MFAIAFATFPTITVVYILNNDSLIILHRLVFHLLFWSRDGAEQLEIQNERQVREYQKHSDLINNLPSITPKPFHMD